MPNAQRCPAMCGLCAAILLLISSTAIALAATPGQPICTEPGHREAPVLVPDGAGGAIVAWSDLRSGNFDLYAQRIEPACAPLWTPGGITVCDRVAWQVTPEAVSDGEGGAFVVWRDYAGPTEGLYAQRLNGFGEPLWTAGGVPVCVGSGDQSYCDVVADGLGGIIVVWEDTRYAGVPAVFAQRLDASGAALWTANGLDLAPSLAGLPQMRPRVLSDHYGGAFCVWSGTRAGGDFSILCQRIIAAGYLGFSPYGQGICTVAGNQTNPRLDHDGWNQIVVTWADDRSGGLAVYAANCDWGGNNWWGSGGVLLGTAAEEYPQLVGDGNGGAIVAWRAAGPTPVMRVRRLFANGATLWTADIGGYADQSPGYPENHRIVPDGTGGAVVCWLSLDGPSLYAARAQRLDAAGAAQWEPGGVVLRQLQNRPVDALRMIADGLGGAIAVWQELAAGSTDYHIYGQGVAADGTIKLPVPLLASVRDVPRDQGGKLQLQWDRSSWDRQPFDRITHYSVWRRLSAAGGAAKRSDHWEWLVNVPALHFERYAATVPSLADSQGTDPGWQVFRVVSHTAVPGDFYASAVDSGYSVDNLSPAIPTGLQATPQAGTVGLLLSWEPVTDPDCDHYEIHRGPGADFIPCAASLVAVTEDASGGDPDWRPSDGLWYKVAAVDRHGNVGGFAVLDPGAIPGSRTPALPAAFFLADARPNPFNPATRIAFGLDVPATVSVSIHDAAGRLVRVILQRRLESGRYEADWRGDDAAGRPVPSGVYICRLTTGSRVETKKLTLVR